MRRSGLKMICDHSAFLHYCMYFSVPLGSGWRYPLVVHLEVILKLVNGLCCGGPRVKCLRVLVLVALAGCSCDSEVCIHEEQ